jgi:hypothetical protein
MAAKKKVSIEVDAETLKKLVATAEALSELAGAWISGSDEPAIKALGKKKGAKKHAK